MACLGHVGSLESKLKSNWNYMKIETKWKWKCDLKILFQTKYLIYLQRAPVMALDLEVFSWPISAM